MREAEATNSLADAGADVIACHVDSPKVVIETAENRGVKSCGHNADQASLAPKGFITGAELRYVTIYKSYTDMIVKGEKLPNLFEGGFDLDMVQNTGFGAGASEAARKAATEATAALKGGAPIFTGPFKDNAEKVVSDKTLGRYDRNRGKFPGALGWHYAGAGRMSSARGGIWAPGMPRRSPKNS